MTRRQGGMAVDGPGSGRYRAQPVLARPNPPESEVDARLGYREMQRRRGHEGESQSGRIKMAR